MGEVPSSGRHRAAGHAIASEGLQAPRTFADTFASLGEARLLEQALASRLQDAARFRNLLVHGYAEIDDARVREILRTRLDDLEQLRVALAGLRS